MNAKQPSQLAGALVTLAICLVGAPAVADIRLEERISVEGAGALKFANMTGTTSTSIAGERARTDNVFELQSKLLRTFGAGGPTAEIVRLDEDRILNLEVQRKQYTETSFAQLRAQLDAAMAQAAEAQSEAQASAAPLDESQCDWSAATAAVTRAGEKARFAGYEAERVTIAGSQSCTDRTTGQVCTMTISLDQWLTPEFADAAELQRYQLAYAEKLGFDAAGSRALTERAQAFFSRYADAWSTVASEMRGLEGYPVRSSFALAMGGPQCEASQSAENLPALPSGNELAAAAGEAAAQSAGSKLGGTLGGIAGQLGGKLAGSMFGRKKPVEAAVQTSDAAILMRITTELVSVERGAIAPGVFEVPSDYKKVSAGT